MRCYCSDLKKIDHDKTSLKSALSSLKVITNRSSTRKSDFSQVATGTKDAIAPAAAGDPASKLNQLESRFSQNIGSLIDTVSGEIDTLQQKYDYLKEQDYQFHHQNPV